MNKTKASERLEINTKRDGAAALFLSMLCPGIGCIYLNKFTTGVLLAILQMILGIMTIGYTLPGLVWNGHLDFHFNTYIQTIPAILMMVVWICSIVYTKILIDRIECEKNNE